ncbi:hypothetical protein NP233_g1183 [Leucocoprinus birnbaumii]|uniref:Cytochrome P450 n=1 Tax=Leucocoprinus birnbaumii TaxID=56174 RepID=A0AAD5W4I0_9AGAR|nr:hypothetical protein NP233_g1183 [Leucocoprinus birnbaumii]
MNSWPAIIILTTVWGLMLSLHAARRRRRRLPPGIVISYSSRLRVGCLNIDLIGLQRPTITPPKAQTMPWEIYKKWSDTCGAQTLRHHALSFSRSYISALGSAIIHLIAHQSDVVVVNNLEAAHELLEIRSHNYSSRPDIPMMELMGRQDNVVIQKYGKRLRVARQMIHETFSGRKSSEWLPVVEKECSELLLRLLDDPTDFRRLIQRYVGSFITCLTYGQGLDVDYLRLVDQVSEHGSQAAVPGRWWVNSYPILKYYPSWAPGGEFQRWARHARKAFNEFTFTPFNRVKQELLFSPGTVPFSFVQKNLARAVEEGEFNTENVVAGTAASLYSAAVDTEKAVEEIRQVIGTERLPNMGDSGELPYVEALIKELHRYHPIVPLLTRSASEADQYQGYLIPKNAWVLVNIWAITHNEEEYDNPTQFEPERFIQGINTRSSPNKKDPRDFTFGIGRRRCPGSTIANAAIYLAITGVLASFSIKASDTKGKDSLEDIKFSGSTISLVTSCLSLPDQLSA